MSVRQADQLPFETVGGGKDTQRQVLIGSEQSPHFAMRRFVMQPGGGMPRHTNTVEHEQTSCAEGRPSASATKNFR